MRNMFEQCHPTGFVIRLDPFVFHMKMPYAKSYNTSLEGAWRKKNPLNNDCLRWHGSLRRPWTEDEEINARHNSRSRSWLSSKTSTMQITCRLLWRQGATTPLPLRLSTQSTLSTVLIIVSQCTMSLLHQPCVNRKALGAQ